jgi:hypothetical protein
VHGNPLVPPELGRKLMTAEVTVDVVASSLLQSRAADCFAPTWDGQLASRTFSVT